jgi:cytidylate kinase
MTGTIHHRPRNLATPTAPAPSAGTGATSAGAVNEAAPSSLSSTTAAPVAAAIPNPVPTPVAALFADPRKEASTKKPGTLKPHEVLMTAVNKPKHASFAAAFTAVLGRHALDELKTALGNKPIVLIAGDQCTGKGTAAEGLVQDLGGANSGTGTVLRALARENGLTIEQMSSLLSGKTTEIVDDKGQKKTVSLKDFPHLGTAEDVDVRLDFRAAKAIAASSLTKADGATLDLTVFESRLAGHLGQFLEGLGRENIVSVYLYAAPRVQAERYLEREVFGPALASATTAAQKSTIEGARAEARALLAGLGEDVGLAACLTKLVEAQVGGGAVPGLAALATKIAGIAGRDDNDKTRLLSLYGVNYQDRSAFDVVVDTNGKTPAEVKQAILDAVAAKTASAASPA